MLRPPCILQALWEAAGKPEPEVPAAGRGHCALCGTTAACAPLRKVVSSNFTDWDVLRSRNLDHDPGVCTAASWVYRARPLRQRNTILHDGTLTVDAPPSMLYAILAVGQLGPHTAVCIPVGGKKHLWHRAAWASVTGDQGPHRWTDADAARLAVLAELRQAGFGEQAVLEPSPPWPLLQRCTDRAHIVGLWPLLDPWRRHNRPVLDMAIRATRKDRT